MKRNLIVALKLSQFYWTNKIKWKSQAENLFRDHIQGTVKCSWFISFNLLCNLSAVCISIGEGWAARCNVWWKDFDCILRQTLYCWQAVKLPQWTDITSIVFNEVLVKYTAGMSRLALSNYDIGMRVRFIPLNNLSFKRIPRQMWSDGWVRQCRSNVHQATSHAMVLMVPTCSPQNWGMVRINKLEFRWPAFWFFLIRKTGSFCILSYFNRFFLSDKSLKCFTDPRAIWKMMLIRDIGLFTLAWSTSRNTIGMDFFQLIEAYSCNTRISYVRAVPLLKNGTVNFLSTFL